MVIKAEKLEQILRKILNEQDSSELTVKKVKRLIEDDMGLEEGSLDSQTGQIKEVLGKLMNEDNGEEDQKPEAVEKPPVVGKRVRQEKEEQSPSKKGKAATTISASGESEMKLSSDGAEYFEIGPMKRVTIKEWKGQYYVDIRNFYAKDGDLLPTSKGLMLSQEQWEAFKDAMPEIDKQLDST